MNEFYIMLIINLFIYVLGLARLVLSYYLYVIFTILLIYYH
jgi:hypothetical protein